MTRRSRERALRRRMILEAAERVFGSRPYHEATMQMIAAGSELGMQGLYDHFPSKQALYEEVIVNRARGFQRLVDEAVQGISDPIGQLRAVALVRVRLFAETPAFLPVFLAEKIRLDWGVRSVTSRRIRRVMREEIGRVVKIVERAIADRLLRREDPTFLCHLFTEAVTASLHVFREHPEEGIESCVDRAMRAFLGGAAASS